MGTQRRGRRAERPLLFRGRPILFRGRMALNGYAEIWTENPFFCFWPFFCLFSGSWPTVIVEALVLAYFVTGTPWYVKLKTDLGGAAAAAVVLSAFAAMAVLDMNNPSLCRPRRWSYA